MYQAHKCSRTQHETTGPSCMPSCAFIRNWVRTFKLHLKQYIYKEISRSLQKLQLNGVPWKYIIAQVRPVWMHWTNTTLQNNPISKQMRGANTETQLLWGLGLEGLILRADYQAKNRHWMVANAPELIWTIRALRRLIRNPRNCTFRMRLSLIQCSRSSTGKL